VKTVERRHLKQNEFAQTVQSASTWVAENRDLTVKIAGAALIVLVVVGGYSFTSVQTVDNTYRYDPVANTWTELAPMPQRTIVSAAVYYPPTNKIYVFGGSDRDLQVVFDLTQIYDIATNSWSMGPTMPAPRSQMAHGYNPANGKIYLNGGYETAFIDSVSDQTWSFDPATGAHDVTSYDCQFLGSQALTAVIIGTMKLPAESPRTRP